MKIRRTSWRASTLWAGVLFSPAAFGDDGAGIGVVFLLLFLVTGALPATIIGVAVAIRPSIGRVRSTFALLLTILVLTIGFTLYAGTLVRDFVVIMRWILGVSFLSLMFLLVSYAVTSLAISMLRRKKHDP